MSRITTGKDKIPKNSILARILGLRQGYKDKSCPDQDFRETRTRWHPCYGDNTPDLSGKMLTLVLQQPSTTFSLMALERLCRTRTGVSCCSVTCHHKIKQPDVGIPLHYGMKQHNSFLYLPKFFKPVQDVFRNRFCSHTKCCVSLSLLLFSLLQASDVPLGHKTQRVNSHLKFEFEING